MDSTSIPLLFVVAALGQAPAELPEAQAAREEKLQFLKDRSAELTLYRQSDLSSPLPLFNRAVLFYSNPVGLSSDGATFLWLSGNRPAAAVSFSIRRPNNAVYRECTSLFEQSLDCRQERTSVWAPKKGGLLAQK